MFKAKAGGRSAMRSTMIVSVVLLLMLGAGCRLIFYFIAHYNPYLAEYILIGLSGPPPLFILGSNGQTALPNLNSSEVDHMAALHPFSDDAPRGTAGPGFLNAAGVETGETSKTLERRVQVVGETLDRKVALLVGSQLQLLNLATLSVESTVDLSGFGSRVGISHDNAFAAVVARPSGSAGIDIINLPTMTRMRTIPLAADSSPNDISFLPGTHDFCIGLRGADVVQCFSLDAGGNDPVREITGCEGAGNFEFSADGERALFSCGAGVWIYDVLSHSVIAKLDGFVSVRGLTIRTDGTRAYVISRDQAKNASFLTVLSLETFEVLSAAQFDQFPADVFLGSGDRVVHIITGSALINADADGVIQDTVPIPGFAITGLAVSVPMD